MGQFRRVKFEGIAGDDTDGHVDDLARFTAPDTIVTVVEEEPEGTGPEAEAGSAGGGATSFTARTPYVSAPLQYSWIVHIVMSSSGSTLVNE